MNDTSFYKKYKPQFRVNMRKYEVLRESILAAIQDGYWQCGVKLPTELELSKTTPFSLGTIQKAIGSLTREGFLQRKRGLGTFVIPIEKRIGGPWIFRCLEKDSAELVPMSTRVVNRKIVSSTEPWAQWLTEGNAEKKLLQINRLILADEYTFYSKYFLDSEQFPIIAKTPLKELNSANFAGLIQDHYQIHLERIDRTIQCITLPSSINQILGKAKNTKGVLVEIMASGQRSKPIFYQQLFLPPNGPRLFFGKSGT